MKKFMSEFREFIARGNVMDMAVGVIIGGAFTAIVTSLTDNIINPLITVITGGGTDMTGSLVVPGTNIDFGAFISAVINFLLHKQQEEEAAEEAAAPTCPYCLEEVKPGATKCPHCGSDLTDAAK